MTLNLVVVDLLIPKIHGCCGLFAFSGS